MNLILHLNIYIFPMVLLASIFMSMRKNSIQTTENSLYGGILLTTFLLLLADIVSWMFDGDAFFLSREINWAANLLYFVVTPFISIIWLNYICFCMRKSQILYISFLRKILLVIPMLLYYIMLFFTPFTHWIFNIDENNCYERGTYFFLPYTLIFIYLMLAVAIEIKTIIHEKFLFRKKQYLYLCFFTAIPIIAASLQAIVPGMWIAYPCTALAELLFYIYLQKKCITSDALTGIYNRGCLDRYIKERLGNKEDRKPVCLFMIDLDRFKMINDTFGHDIGDEALIRTATIISDCFRKTDTFVARYGGDEFCIVNSAGNDNEAAKTIAKLQTAFDEANAAGQALYYLTYSIGYKLINDNTDISPEELIMLADTMMYKQKNRRHEA